MNRHSPKCHSLEFLFTELILLNFCSTWSIWDPLFPQKKNAKNIVIMKISDVYTVPLSAILQGFFISWLVPQVYVKYEWLLLYDKGENKFPRVHFLFSHRHQSGIGYPNISLYKSSYNILLLHYFHDKRIHEMWNYYMELYVVQKFISFL